MASRQFLPLLVEEPNEIDVLCGDADSSARAMQEMAPTKQEKGERTRAGLLLRLLIFMACLSVYFLTKSKVTPIPTPFSKGSEERIDYGGNKGSGGDGGGGGGGGDSDLGGGNPDRASSNTTKHDSILDHLTDAMAESTPAFTPFFFHVPRSGGQTVKDVVGLCLLKTQASEVGIRDGHQTDAQLQIVTIENAKYVNVDTTTKEGIERAAMMGFAQAQLAEMVTSSYFLNSAQFLFSEEHPGRAFIMFRNPVHAAVSMYYYQRSTGALDERITLEEFARGNGVENNWMTRSLTNAMEGELRTSHLYLAKKILIKKFLVGFLDDIDESVARLIKYMGWKYDDDETKALLQQECIKSKLIEGSNKNPTEHELPKKGSQSSALLSWQTQFDMKLYEFAKQLFDLQTEKFGSKERKEELKKKD